MPELIQMLYSYSGSAQKARQMLTSILYHVSNIHTFSDLDLYPACGHDADIEERQWIPMGNGYSFLSFLIISFMNSPHTLFMKEMIKKTVYIQYSGWFSTAFTHIFCIYFDFVLIHHGNVSWFFSLFEWLKPQPSTMFFI